jgi:hypothetical protein
LFTSAQPGYAVVKGLDGSVVKISNSIFFGNLNGSTSDSADIYLDASAVNVSNTITQFYNTGNSFLPGINPKFVDAGSVTGSDNLYFTQDDGLQLLNPCSPALNSGSNSAAAAITKDILSNSRLFGSNVDVGAYEAQANPLPAPSVIYVNSIAKGLNNGTSWANAFTDLQKAMHQCSDTIKIAAGYYYPSDFDVNAFFEMQNKRVLFGGYPATGNPSDNQRNPVLNPTIFTGRLPFANGSKAWALYKGKSIDSSSVTDGIIFSNSGNAYLSQGCVDIYLGSSPSFNNCTFKDSAFNGISIRSGSDARLINCKFDKSSANISFSSPKLMKCTFNSGEGINITNSSSTAVDSCNFIYSNISYHGNSAGTLKNSVFYGNNSNSIIYINNSSPVISNCIFSDSLWAENGGMLYNTNQGTPVFTKCEFRDSKALYNGGAVYNDNASVVFNGCIFSNPSSKYGEGGGFYNTNGGSITLNNCIAFGSSGKNGFILNKNSQAKINNCTFAGNSGTIVTNTDNAVLKINNTAMWGNVYGANPDIVNTSGSADISNSITQSYGSNALNGNIVSANPRFIDITNPAGPDKIFFTEDDGFRLCNCSPGINAGLNTAASGLATDILNLPRIFNGVVDIGAYEFQSAQTSSAKTFYVKSNASGNNDGSSWSNAYKELSIAMQNTCADTIKVAMGIYKPALISRDSSFYINRHMNIIGGYPDTGNPPDSLRSPDTYPTILSGNIGNIADSADNTLTLMPINCRDTSVSIEGLTFKNSTAGAIYSSVNKNLSIYNCRFSNNYSNSGSAINIGDNATISRCVCSDNNSKYGTYTASGYNTLVKDCIFYKNKSILGGGAYQAVSTFVNTIFYKNEATYGAGVYYSGDPDTKFINCDFIKNNATQFHIGIGLLSYSAASFDAPRLKLRNCIFRDNTFQGNPITNQNSDWAKIYPGGSGNSYYRELDIRNCAAIPYSGQYYINNVPYYHAVLKNIDDGPGPDNLWFTKDDGLQLAQCAPGAQVIDIGDNASVAAIPKDILQNERVFNNRVDMGAYEYREKLMDNVLATAGATVSANRSFSDTATGYLGYYNNCNYMLSAKSAKGYGYLGDGATSVKITTTPSYATGQPTNLSDALYVTPGLSWNAMNRYWEVNPRFQIYNDSVLIRFPFSNSDFNDLKAGNPSLTSPQQLVFYSVDSPFKAFDLNVPSNKFHLLVNGAAPSTSIWKYSKSDSANYAEFYVKKLGTGGAGFGNGYNNGPEALASNGCTGATRIIGSNISGAAYQWQLKTVSGFINISNNAVYSGVSSPSLTITNPPSSMAGSVYRCQVNSVSGTAYSQGSVIKFQNTWTGSVSSAWENPANWSCGILPDGYTDVVINTGTVVLNSNASCRSISIKPGVNFSIGTGFTLTITK